MYKFVGKDNLKGRFFRFALTAILSFAMCITGISSSFYAYAEDGSDSSEKEVTVLAENKDEGGSKKAAASEESSSKEKATPEKAEPAQENTEAAAEKTEEAADNKAPDTDKEAAVTEETLPADNEEKSEDGNSPAYKDGSLKDESVQEAANEVQHEKTETKETTAEPDSDPKKAAPKKAALMSSAAAPAESGEAKIGNKTYASVHEAVEAAANGDVIELIKDVVIKTTIEIIGKIITISDDGNARVIKNEENTKAPLFTVRNGSELTLNGSSAENLKLQGGSTSAYNSATVLIVEGIANIKNVLIDGGLITGGSSTGAVNVRNGGRLNMSGGIIENTTITGNGDKRAAVVVKEKSHFEMSGGEIRNNKNYTSGQNLGSGGVALTAFYTDRSTMKMSGGKIINNYAYDGGGIFMSGSSELHMTGGSIEGNEANRYGGGVCSSGLWDSGYRTENPTLNDSFIFDGGSISNNKAWTGGGIYVNSDGTYLNGGYIENNSARNHGGGVYLSVAPYVLHVSKAVITENTATNAGGGIWTCPTGEYTFKVTDGIAVYNNTSKGAGDDITSQSNGWFGGGGLTIPDRMLGGGAVIWYRDGSTYAGDVGPARPSVPRFDAENPGNEVHLDGYHGGASLKAVTTDAAALRANHEATLFIRNNTAAQGGGIGTNGGVTLPSMDYKDWKLLAEKKWEDIEDADDKEVKVFLKIGDQILDSITLNKDNEWKGEFTGLPDPSSLSDENITIVEGEMVEDENGNMVFKETSQYTVRYERVVLADDSVIYVLVTNSPLPPEEPEEEETVTEEVEETETVEEAEKDDDNDDEVKDEYETVEETDDVVIKTADSREVKAVKAAAKSSGVATGDSSKAFIYILVLMISAASAASIVYRRRKE